LVASKLRDLGDSGALSAEEKKAERSKLVQRQLEEIKIRESSNTQQAKMLARDIIMLYENEPDQKEAVDQARARLKALE
jgi:hypothetical protein